MTDNTKSFGETAKSLARNPLGIIALFIVLVYGSPLWSRPSPDRSLRRSDSR